MIPKSEWEWFGHSAHFCCGQWCRFHLATKVGNYLISTIGEFVHPMRSKGNEKDEFEWLKENWPGDDIGPGRKYETMVFRVSDQECGCGCGMPRPDDFNELTMMGYNTSVEARQGHMKLCERFAEKKSD